MRQLSSLVLLLLSACSYLAQAQVPFPGECPTNVKAMEVFDLDAYTGVWYEYTKYPFVFEVGKKCIYARYGNNGNNTVSVQNFSINRITNTPSNIKGTARVLAPATLAVQFSPFQPADKPNYVVLGTDYTSYAVVYSCTSLGTFAHTKVVWILTRDRQPSEAAIKTGKDIMDANKLSQTYLIDTLQTDCPAVTDNSSSSNSNGGDTVAQLNNAISRG